ncbi:uncharacterized protein B0H18DRAFT_1023161 [Fomitopsis serialis]|uniref:uncharacterized protein n=1 Tax=Fomitopsis serialis TaxID=139415 RepID=UPI00200732A4|nr:uncharacterized protein B0H18DRAFT_1023161 [Neoantrodia serialis]KAH9920782.1 hypothetical protein B0H18DRAFT_1023161 [Neoantrodia serialis]
MVVLVVQCAVAVVRCVVLAVDAAREDENKLHGRLVDLWDAASLLNIDVVILDVGDHAPAKQVVSPRSVDLAHIDGSFTDPAKIRQLAAKVDVLTVEIEHVDVDVLHPSTIRVIQDKLVQKEHLVASGCPVSQFLQVESTVASVTSASETLGLPLMLKSRTLAYDGRGNYVVRHCPDPEAIAALGGRPLYAEKWVPFVKEIAVMVVRSATGEIASYPVVETVHRDNICHLVFAPLRSSDEASVKTLEGAGVFGVEMFLVEDGSVVVNEIAPRPHNSGHYTIEACETSQYENHLRAILSLPLGSTALKVPSAAMLNLLGASGDVTEISAVVEHALKVPGAAAHLYGKSDRRLRPLLEQLPSPSSAAELALHAPLAPEPGSGFSHRQPLVGIIMGSDSDLPVMVPSARILDRFGIPYELTIVSAHRTPDRMTMYARSAVSRGLRVIIAGAGGAAHLPGMVAAMTSLPVVGVPVKGSTLDGVDSLHSIVQMPRGVPVATVAINNGMNAGLLAVRILASGIPDLVHKMDDYLKEQTCEVHEKVQKLEVTGWEKYLLS